MNEIVKTSELSQFVPGGRQNNIRYVIYNPATGRTQYLSLQDQMGLSDSNARTLKIVSTENYTVQAADRDKILFFTFEEGDITVTFTDGLAEVNEGEFLLVCGDASTLLVVGDGIDIQKSRAITNRLPNWGVGRVRLISNNPSEVGTFNSGFYLYGGFEPSESFSSAVRPIIAGWDGGAIEGVDQPLTTGLRYETRALVVLDPVEWTILPKSGSTGDITIEVRKKPFSTGSFTSITAGSPPTSTAGARTTGSAAAWTAINEGDLIEFEVTAVSGSVTGATIIIKANEL